MAEYADLDRTDFAILSLLQNDARLTKRERRRNRPGAIFDT
jgi:hypothetical protein